MFASKDTLLTRPSGYQIQRSLRFRSSASAYLNRTFGTPTNNNTWTFSTWMKRGSVSSGGTPIFVVYVDGNNYTNFTIDANQQMNFAIVTSGVARANSITSQVFRDPSSWYHVVLVANRAEATEANRIKMYINGVQVTAWATAPTWNNSYDSAINGNGQVNLIGNRSTAYFDGYLAEINFIDGQALTPSSFGAINAVTGVWSATKYAGTYGTNGFYLNFTDNSAATATTIGKDYSGNGNNWTPNNISVTAGSTYDSMLDAPLGAGGGERGNYAVLNPLEKPANDVLANANLQFTGGTSGTIGFVPSTVGVSSGKWYFEVTLLTSARVYAGIVATSRQNSGNVAASANPDGYDYRLDTGDKRNNNTATAYGNSLTANDVLGCAFNLDTGKIWWSKNGTWQASGDPGAGTNEAFSGISGTFCGEVGHDSYAAPVVAANFGQRPFSYTPPTGFKALHTGNLAAPVIALPAQNMAATLYTGNGSTQSIVNTVNSVSFQPDFVWVKGRSTTARNRLFNVLSGVQKELYSDLTNAEATDVNGIQSFNANGFTLGSNDANTSGTTYVGWQWKGGGTGVSNTAGSITSSVSANVSAGFSVVTYTGNGTSNATVGHGLGVAPSFFIIKNRSSATDWPVYHKSLPSHDGGNYPTNSLRLNTTGALANTLGLWVAPTSTVIQIDDGQLSAGNRPLVNTNGSNYVAYCFAPVAGYSAFGSYTGNGSADGPFVYTGFRPRYVMIKGSSFVSNWFVIDTSRSSYNVSLDALRPNLDGAETSTGTYSIDILSNGFKLRTSAADSNTSSATFIYAAFAENPFKNSLAR